MIITQNMRSEANGANSWNKFSKKGCDESHRLFENRSMPDRDVETIPPINAYGGRQDLIPASVRISFISMPSII